MRLALGLARAQKGRTGDNPSVGCVIVKDGEVIGKGATADGGRPHGEIMALQSCGEFKGPSLKGESIKGASVYVTLEPCAHIGRSGACVDALIGAGIARCVIAAIDPNPLVNWQGAARLQEAGIDTIIGLCEDEAQDIMASFFARFQHAPRTIS